MIDQHHGWNKSVKPLFLGYTVSIILLFAAYRFFTRVHLTGAALDWALFGFVIAQAFLQLIFFLHLGVEEKPRWNLITTLFTAAIIVIIVAGSIWIMHNINYNLMPDIHG